MDKERRSTIVINDFSTRKPRISSVIRFQDREDRKLRYVEFLRRFGQLLDFVLQVIFLPLIAGSKLNTIVGFAWVSVTVV